MVDDHHATGSYLRSEGQGRSGVDGGGRNSANRACSLSFVLPWLKFGLGW